MLCKNSLAGEFVDAVCNRVAIALNTSALPLSAKLTGNALILSGLFVLAVGTPRERKVIWLPPTPRSSKYFLAAIIRFAARLSPEFMSAREPIYPCISIERLLYSFKMAARFSRTAMSDAANSALEPWLRSLKVSDRATLRLMIWGVLGIAAATFWTGLAGSAIGACGSTGSCCSRGGVFCKPKPSNNSLSLTVIPAYSPPDDLEPLKSRSIFTEPVL